MISWTLVGLLVAVNCTTNLLRSPPVIRALSVVVAVDVVTTIKETHGFILTAYDVKYIIKSRICGNSNSRQPGGQTCFLKIEGRTMSLYQITGW